MERSRACWRCICQSAISTNCSWPLRIARLDGEGLLQGRSLGRQLLAFTRTHLPDEIHLRCVRENVKAWRWYEREGFVFDKEQVEPMTGLVMKHYRWTKQQRTTDPREQV